jgi:acylphosphatase
LKGLVRNLEGARVEVFCEGPPYKVEGFLKKIDRKAEAEDFLSVNVSRIKCSFEGEEDYQPAWREYKYFEVDYGVGRLSAFEESTLEDHEFSKLYFIGFRDELKTFSENTDSNFKETAEKYGGHIKRTERVQEDREELLRCFSQAVSEGNRQAQKFMTGKTEKERGKLQF